MLAGNATILVLGLGNTLLSDEAMGVRVVEALTALEGTGEDPRARGLTCLDGGTMGLSLLIDMEDADALILVDAAQLGAEPGSLRVFEGREMDGFLKTRGINPHDIGLEDLMDALRLREAVPGHRALVAVQPQSLSVGDALTPKVAGALPGAVEAVLALADSWRVGS